MIKFNRTERVWLARLKAGSYTVQSPDERHDALSRLRGRDLVSLSIKIVIDKKTKSRIVQRVARLTSTGVSVVNSL